VPGLYLTEEKGLKGIRRKNRRWKIKGEYDEDIEDEQKESEREERLKVKE